MSHLCWAITASALIDRNDDKRWHFYFGSRATITLGQLDPPIATLSADVPALEESAS